MVECQREAKNRGWKGNFAFVREIYLLDFFRLTPRPRGGGGSFVREVLMISPRANCSCMRKTGKLMDYRETNDFSISF